MASPQKNITDLEGLRKALVQLLDRFSIELEGRSSIEQPFVKKEVEDNVQTLEALYKEIAQRIEQQDIQLTEYNTQEQLKKRQVLEKKDLLQGLKKEKGQGFEQFMAKFCDVEVKQKLLLNSETKKSLDRVTQRKQELKRIEGLVAVEKEESRKLKQAHLEISEDLAEAEEVYKNLSQREYRYLQEVDNAIILRDAQMNLLTNRDGQKMSSVFQLKNEKDKIVIDHARTSEDLELITTQMLVEKEKSASLQKELEQALVKEQELDSQMNESNEYKAKLVFEFKTLKDTYLSSNNRDDRSVEELQGELTGLVQILKENRVPFNQEELDNIVL